MEYRTVFKENPVRTASDAKLASVQVFKMITVVIRGLK
jgi:hypothetical protein